MKTEEELIWESYNTKQVINNPNFKKWFGDSKVVDKNGDPLVMYHGTPSWLGINEFNKPKTDGNWTPMRGGIWFTPSKATADNYAMSDFQPNETGIAYGKRGSHLVPVYLKMERPLDLRKSKARKEWIELKKSSGVSDPTKHGYDGVILSKTEYVMVEPTHIKSAINNNGNFDPNNPNITK